MQSRMEFKEATFYKASSSFHYKGKGSILKPHTCCEYPDSLLEDGTLSAQARLPAYTTAPLLSRPWHALPPPPRPRL